MLTPKPEQPSMIERVERALVLLAYFIELDGDIHVAMYEKFETELAELKKREETKDRARRLLSSYKRSGGRNDSLQEFELQFQRRPLAVLGLVGSVTHQTIDQAVRRFRSDQPILEAVPQRMELPLCVRLSLEMSESPKPHS